MARIGRWVVLLVAACVGAAIAISRPAAAQESNWGMDTPVPLVWNEHGKPTPTRSTYKATVGSFVTVIHTRAPQYETFSLYAPGCAVHYQGAVGAHVLLETENIALSRQDPDLPLISFMRSAGGIELRLKTGARNDLARVIQKMSAFKSVGMLRTPARSTPRSMKWTDKGFVGDQRIWEGTLADLVDDFATVRYSVSPMHERYMTTASGCRFLYGGPRQTMLSVDLQEGDQRKITIDRRHGPETQFLVSAPTPDPAAAGVLAITRRVPSEKFESTWISQPQVTLNLDLGEFSASSTARRSAIVATPYALVNRDHGIDDTLNMNTPSCSVLQGRFGNDLWILVYDAASDAFVKVLRKSLGQGEHKVVVDTRGAPPPPGDAGQKAPHQVPTPPGAILH